jgi:hypothetical protein
MPWRHIGERRYSSDSFLALALDGGEWSASRPGRALPPVPIVQAAGWAPEPVWTQRLEEKSSASVGDRTPIVQSVVRHYTDWATWSDVYQISSLNKDKETLLLYVNMSVCGKKWVVHGNFDPSTCHFKPCHDEWPTNSTSSTLSCPCTVTHCTFFLQPFIY